MAKPLAALLVAGVVNREDLREFDSLRNELEKEATTEHPAPFQPPSIVAVEATRR
jgi:hypothetical protein